QPRPHLAILCLPPSHPRKQRAVPPARCLRGRGGACMCPVGPGPGRAALPIARGSTVMSMLSNPAFGPRIALAYVTAGALINVWTVVYFFTRAREGLSNNGWFWLAGFFFSGVTLIVLGLVLGPLGRAARKAELPPNEAAGAEARINQTAAAAGTP